MIESLQWTNCPEAMAREILASVLEVEPKELEALVVGGRTAPLPFYRHWQLIHLLAKERVATDPKGGGEELYALWREGYPPKLLDGRSAPLYEANEDETLSLDPGHVADYIRYFCFVLRAGSGPFILFEHPPARIPRGREAAAAIARPLTSKGVDDTGNFLYAATIIYDGSAFNSVLSVQPNGETQMLDDEPLDVPIPPNMIPFVPVFGTGGWIRAHLAGVGSSGVLTSRPATRRGRARAAQSDKPAIVVMVELLLERALLGQAGNRLIEHFNATSPPGDVLERFAALMLDGSPVVIVETTIPFVEEIIGRIVDAHTTPPGQFRIVAPSVGGDDTSIGFDLPAGGPAIILIPLQVYSSAPQSERLGFDIAIRDLAAIITCDRFGQLPESFRRIKDIVLRLPPIDPGMFAAMFDLIMGVPIAAGWEKGGSDWVRHVLHTDFEHPRRMKLAARLAVDFIRAQVQDRLAAVDSTQGLRLSELYGLGEAREFAEDLIADIHAAMAGTLPWSQVDRGALLVGAPGTGKTTLANAIARDCGVRFIAASATSWQAQGSSLGPHIEAIRRTFREAREYAPSILFIDEIDSIGNREEFAGTNNAVYQTEVVNAVLEQMQGMDPAAPVFVIGATNDARRIDPALRRSGRLDRVITIPRPNSEALQHIYRYYLRALGPASKPARDVDTRALGGLSIGLTGADVERIVRGAARRARKANRLLSQTDLIAELTDKPRGSASLRLTPEELERTAVHEAGHALAVFLGASRGADIGFVTVVPRDDGTLGFNANLPDERVSLNRSDYAEKLEIYLGGRAAEALIYGADQVSGGASSDLQSATALVSLMITKLGLGGNAKLLWSESMSPADLVVAEATLAQAYTSVLEKLTKNEARLRALAAALVARQELPGNEVRAILKRRPSRPRPGSGVRAAA